MNLVRRREGLDAGVINWTVGQSIGFERHRLKQRVKSETGDAWIKVKDMAISGNLKDISFVELLRLIGKRTGRLCVFDFNNKRQHEWYLHQNQVRAVRVSHIALFDEADVYQTALDLALDNTSSYIFYKQETISEKFPFEIEIAIDKLMTTALSIVSASTSDSSAQHFPHQETKFEAISNQSVGLFDDSLKFWQQNAELLRLGASASEIAHQTLTDVNFVRVELYKLKLLGVIRPIRAFAKTFDNSLAPGGQTLSEKTLSEKTLPQALPTGLEKFEAVNKLAPFAPVVVNSENYTKFNERKNLVNRMLSSLFGLAKLI